MPASAPAPAASRTRALASRAWRGTKRLILYGALALVALAALYLLAAYHFSYSSGERAGYVQKFSKKGWLCKTWEGELAMANLPGAMPEKFAFTLHDDKVAAEINKAMGQRVTLSYEQKVGLPSCFGDTPYWVTQVRPIEPAK
ncbi:MAG TPA: hypothetical protein VFC77_01860 [Myxococcota bacterium]|nr:hypothetical protein [Myxococcota bacterium]